jgi:hypothetical protein
LRERVLGGRADLACVRHGWGAGPLSRS